MTSATHAKRTAIVAIAAAAALALSACGNGVANHSAPTTATAQTVTPQSTAEAKTAETASANLPDPRSLAGLSEVPELPDPQPIKGNFPQQLPVKLKDFDGNDVTITDTSRIVTLDVNGTIARSVISLGYGDKIVGRTVSDVEQQLKDLPVVTENGHTLNAEAVMSLEPTLIIADRTIGPPEALQQIRASGVPVVMIDPERSLEKTGPQIKAIAAALGVPAAGEALAKRTAAEIEDAKSQIAKWAPKEPMSGAFLYVRGQAGIFFILGGENGASSLLQALGLKDAASEAGIKSLVPANAESLVKLNSDVILTMTHGLESTGGLDGFLKRPGVKNTTAGQKQRIVAIPDGISLSFGPQTGQILTSVAKAIYGVK